MEDKTIYVKEGRKYRPIGICEPINWLPDGIWLANSKRSCKSRTNMEWLSRIYGFTRIGDIPMADYTKVAKMELYADAVGEVLTKHNIPPHGICIQDLAREIIAAMYEVNEQKK